LEFLAVAGVVKSWNFPKFSYAAWRHSCHCPAPAQWIFHCVVVMVATRFGFWCSPKCNWEDGSVDVL